MIQTFLSSRFCEHYPHAIVCQGSRNCIHMCLVSVLVRKKMSVLIYFLMQNTYLMTGLTNFANSGLSVRMTSFMQIDADNTL